MGTDSPYLLASVSLLSALHLGYLARQVGLARIAHKVLPPSVTGPPEFERTYRAHQNCVEFYPIFLVVMWTCGMFFSEVAAATAGLVFIFARHIYFNGYVKSSKKRLRGFYLTVAVTIIMAALGLIGVVFGMLHKYFHIRHYNFT